MILSSECSCILGIRSIYSGYLFTHILVKLKFTQGPSSSGGYSIPPSGGQYDQTPAKSSTGLKSGYYPPNQRVMPRVNRKSG